MKKAVYDYTAGVWTPVEERLFVYDGWNLVEEIDRQGGNETSRYFVWGLDMSQSMQGAGKIGGLVASVDSSSGSSLTYYFCYDGNGNVGQVVSASDGSIAAAYEYDPYGKVLKADGAYAEDNPFRFSTKYWDDETGLVYYGYRYYSSELGRWVSRDPIGERGGQNIYVFVQNNAIKVIDLLGLFTECPCDESSTISGEFIYSLGPDDLLNIYVDKNTTYIVDGIFNSAYTFGDDSTPKDISEDEIPKINLPEGSAKFGRWIKMDVELKKGSHWFPIIWVNSYPLTLGSWPVELDGKLSVDASKGGKKGISFKAKYSINADVDVWVGDNVEKMISDENDKNGSYYKKHL